MAFTKEQQDLARIKSKEARENKPQLIEELLTKLDKKYHSCINGVPYTYRLNMLQILVGDKRVSPQQSIKFKCLDCSNWDREKIKECVMRQCPLYSWRPYQNKNDVIEEEN